MKRYELTEMFKAFRLVSFRNICSKHTPFSVGAPTDYYKLTSPISRTLNLRSEYPFVGTANEKQNEIIQCGSKKAKDD